MSVYRSLLLAEFSKPPIIVPPKRSLVILPLRNAARKTVTTPHSWLDHFVMLLLHYRADFLNMREASGVVHVFILFPAFQICQISVSATATSRLSRANKSLWSAMVLDSRYLRWIGPSKTCAPSVHNRLDENTHTHTHTQLHYLDRLDCIYIKNDEWKYFNLLIYSWNKRCSTAVCLMTQGLKSFTSLLKEKMTNQPLTILSLLYLRKRSRSCESDVNTSVKYDIFFLYITSVVFIILT